ncbi:hypothetical protein BRX40_16975 [Sphingomonas koreensis]|nr:hypothetical protein BRX40_16975 [Sphingomonas koreensis]
MDVRVFSLLVTIALGGCGTVERGSADRFTSSGELLAVSGGDAGARNACVTCHGIDGRGNGAGTPRLAGLDRGYMAGQLEAYSSGRRRHPEMEWIARKLTPAQQDAVSAYYAAMPYRAATQPIRGTMAARALYHRGDRARGLAACASCHGARGEGVGAANPPLAGQPAAYLSHQLDQWRQGARRNDPEGSMQRISRALSPREAAALAAYASLLPGDPPHRVSPATSREARRVDPRNGASAQPRHAAGSPPAR